MNEFTTLIPVLDRIIQWIVIPIGVILWNHSKKHTEHEKTFIRMEGENKRILAVLEERATQRDEDRKQERETLSRLTDTVDKLNDRLDAMITSQASKGGG